MKNVIYFLGYIQPELLISRLQSADYDGLMDRHIVGISQRREVRFRDIGSKEVDVDLAQFFKAIVTSHHREETVYKLNEEAGKLYEEFFDGMEKQIAAAGSAGHHHIIGMLNKAAVSPCAGSNNSL
jgi:hypothetical protein